MGGVLYALVGTLFTFGITTLGAASVFFMKQEINEKIQSVFLGFAAGVMVAASIWSLLTPGMEQAQQLGQISWLVCSVGFVLGVILLYATDSVFQKMYYRLQQNHQLKKCRKSTLMMLFAITMHNIPEGMAVGIAFAAAKSALENIGLLSGAIALTVGIGIQNFPEGTAVSLSLIRDEMEKKSAFLIGSLSAVVEPIFGVLSALLYGAVLSWMPLLLAFASGAMIYVVVQELIPEAHFCSESKGGTTGFVVGFLIMMILDVAL
ncbi:MAG: ZIP family metal transporter [Lachnospiraceae bacterium]|nr:ZIP family metal transporter [Lachnospiraceae bacterium]